MEICDRMVVLRDGNYIAALDRAEFDANTIKKHMVGREMGEKYYRNDWDGTLSDEIVLDVREQDEYDEKHISEAILLPVGMIDEDTAEGVIPEKDTPVLVYCRSGNRSKTASQKLVDLGYTQVYEFGGIKDWPYETE